MGYLQHEIFTPFWIECLSAYAGCLDEPCGNSRYAVPVFSTTVNITSGTATSFFPLETQPKTETESKHSANAYQPIC